MTNVFFYKMQVAKNKSKLSKMTGYSDLERLEIDLNNILSGVDTNEGRAIRKYIRDLTSREGKGLILSTTPDIDIDFGSVKLNFWNTHVPICTLQLQHREGG